ncbi:putative F-box/kelch-repeat protein At1g12870 isoform X2 [Elaeis guineensis]
METITMKRKSLPEDIVMLILAQLPVKSIMRFRCVSKQWHSLLCFSYFRDLHRSIQDAKGNRHFLISLSHDSLDLCLHAISEDNDNKRPTLVGWITSVAGGHRARLAAPPCEGLVCLSVDEQQSVIVIVCLSVARWSASLVPPRTAGRFSTVPSWLWGLIQLPKSTSWCGSSPPRTQTPNCRQGSKTRSARSTHWDLPAGGRWERSPTS